MKSKFNLVGIELGLVLTVREAVEEFVNEVRSSENLKIFSRI